MYRKRGVRRVRVAALIAIAVAAFGLPGGTGGAWASGASNYAETNKPGHWCYAWGNQTFSNTDARFTNITGTGGVYCNFAVASIGGNVNVVRWPGNTIGMSEFGCSGCHAADAVVFRSDTRLNMYSTNTYAVIVLPPGEIWFYGFPTASGHPSSCRGWLTSTLTCDVTMSGFAP
jgi:hypothetical protein